MYLPAWLVLPHNVKVYTESFLPNGSSLDLRATVLQLSPLGNGEKLPKVVQPSESVHGIWHTGLVRLSDDPMYIMDAARRVMKITESENIEGREKMRVAELKETGVARPIGQTFHAEPQGSSSLTRGRGKISLQERRIRKRLHDETVQGEWPDLLIAEASLDLMQRRALLSLVAECSAVAGDQVGAQAKYTKFR